MEAGGQGEGGMKLIGLGRKREREKLVAFSSSVNYS